MGKHRVFSILICCLAAVLLAAGSFCLAGVAAVANQPLTVLMYHHIVEE